MSSQPTITCRRCQTPNRTDNAYCRKCGVALNISTTEIRAQRKPVMPKLRGMQWRFLFVGFFVMLGIVFTLVAVSAFTARVLGLGGTSIDGIAQNVLPLTFATAGIFFVGFGVSGYVLAWLARRRISTEVAVSTTLVLALLGVVGSLVTPDLAIVAGVAFVPSLVSAVLGVRLARPRDKDLL